MIPSLDPPHVVITYYVVYESPLDYPGEFVVRRHFSMSDGHGYAEQSLFARGGTLEYVRLFVPNGLKNFGRFRDDDPAIREVWI